MSNIEGDRSKDWLKDLSPSEFAHWEAKNQADKDHFCVTFKPEERAWWIRSEIRGAATYKRLQELPESKRNAIIADLDQRAKEAKRGFGEKAWMNEPGVIMNEQKYTVYVVLKSDDLERLMHKVSDYIGRDGYNLVGGIAVESGCGNGSDSKKTWFYQALAK